MPFQVGGTKKGALPVVTEKRPRGKVVTVIRNIKGDKDELTKLLKTALGTGGHEIAHDTIEVQGDHAAKIQGLLLKHQASTGVATMKGAKSFATSCARIELYWVSSGEAVAAFACTSTATWPG